MVPTAVGDWAKARSRGMEGRREGLWYQQEIRWGAVKAATGALLQNWSETGGLGLGGTERVICYSGSPLPH